MKILYHHRIASKDGQYVHVDELTRALKRQGHEIIMVSPTITETDDFGSEGGLVPLLKKYIPQFIYELLELSYAVYAYRKLARAVKTHQPDCLYERYNLYMPAGVWIKRRFRLPMLSEVNAPIFNERSKYHGIALKSLAKWSENYVWRGADKVLPVTRVLAGYVEAAGVLPENIMVIPNGIDEAKFNDIPDIDSAKQKLGLSGKLVLGFTGFMREWHGLERVVDLIAQHSDEDRHLLLVGDGPARSDIEKRARSLGVSDKVTITGVVSRDHIADYVSTFDIALQPDVVEYASPLKLFEYLALARAIVAPNTANIREVLTHEKNALLFNQEHANGFVDAVERLCQDETLRMRIAHAARNTIAEAGYTWDENARRVAQCFVELGVKDTRTPPGGSAETAD